MTKRKLDKREARLFEQAVGEEPTRRPASGGRPVRALRGDELDLWRQVVRDVEPLSGEHAAVEPPPTDHGARRALGGEAAAEASAAGAAASVPAATPSSPAAPAPPLLKPGATAGLDRRSAQRLKRGQYPVEGRLDLHGQTQDSARRMLDKFLAEAQAGGKRCVLVITGKGRARGDYGAARPGVLRMMVPKWLNEAPNRGRIVAFTHARRDQGGEGALYVLLKRKRS